MHGKGFVQRPARRDSAAGRRASGDRLRAVFRYVPSALKFAVAVAGAAALVVGYRALTTASLFQVRTIDVSGTSRISAEEIATLTRRAVAHTGVWQADLSALSAELGRLPGVRRATVARVMPDGLRVRITERAPVAVVHTSSGRFIWVDDEGVAVGDMKPTDRMPEFFIRGWSEEGTSDAGEDNQDRVKKYLELVRQWDAAGLSQRVSEVNLMDLSDVRAQLAGNDSQIEVRLGGRDLDQRLKLALDVLDEYKQTPRGVFITYIDIAQGKRAVIGFSSGAKLLSENEATVGSSSQNQTSDVSAVIPDTGVAVPHSSKSRAATANRSGDREQESGQQFDSHPSNRIRRFQ